MTGLDCKATLGMLMRLFYPLSRCDTDGCHAAAAVPDLTAARGTPLVQLRRPWGTPSLEGRATDAARAAYLNSGDAGR